MLTAKKMVAFTLIDGVFTTYVFPNVQRTPISTRSVMMGAPPDITKTARGSVPRYYFGKWRVAYPIRLSPDAVETEIFGIIADETGALTG